MVIGDAHDQPALALHQVLHIFDAFSLSSCPALCRASTFFKSCVDQDVDGRDKPGHDGGSGY